MEKFQWVRRKPEHPTGDYYFSGKCLVTSNVLEKLGSTQLNYILFDLLSYLKESESKGHGIDYFQVYENKETDEKIYMIDQLTKSQLEGDGYTEEEKKEYNHYTVLFSWEY